MPILTRLLGSKTKLAAIAGILAMILKSFWGVDVTTDAITELLGHVDAIIAFVGLWFLRDTKALN